MTCDFFVSWFDIFYQEDFEEPSDHGECYKWHDDYEGWGENVCKYWKERE
jgi:hypothetical protein